MNTAKRQRLNPGEISRSALKNQTYRDKEKAAFNSLRLALYADPREQWRIQKVDIIEGAIIFIRKLIGVEHSAVQYSDKENDSNNNTKIGTSEKQKITRKRESGAVQRLKNLLMEHSKEAYPKMNIAVVLETAAEFIRSSGTKNLDSISKSNPTMPSHDVVVSDQSNPSICMKRKHPIVAETNEPIPSTSIGNKQNSTPEPVNERPPLKLWRPW